MPFKKGQSGNPNGRQKGSKNKDKAEFKDALNNLLEYSAPQMVDWLNEVDNPEKRFDILSKFAEYIHPKLARTETENNTNVTYNIGTGVPGNPDDSDS